MKVLTEIMSRFTCGKDRFVRNELVEFMRSIFLDPGDVFDCFSRKRYVSKVSLDLHVSCLFF